MENEFIPEKQSMDLKQLGFDEPCLAYYVNGNFRKGSFRLGKFPSSADYAYNHNFTVGNLASAPLFQQAFRWFRENHGLFFNLNSEDPAREDVYWYIYIFGKTQGRRDIKIRMIKTYKEAELACLIKLIEIVKNKQK
jgi:hypothetical protein